MKPCRSVRLNDDDDFDGVDGNGSNERSAIPIQRLVTNVTTPAEWTTNTTTSAVPPYAGISGTTTAITTIVSSNGSTLPTTGTSTTVAAGHSIGVMGEATVTDDGMSRLVRRHPLSLLSPTSDPRNDATVTSPDSSTTTANIPLTASAQFHALRMRSFIPTMNPELPRQSTPQDVLGPVGAFSETAVVTTASVTNSEDSGRGWSAVVSGPRGSTHDESGRVRVPATTNSHALTSSGPISSSDPAHRKVHPKDQFVGLTEPLTETVEGARTSTTGDRPCTSRSDDPLRNLSDAVVLPTASWHVGDSITAATHPRNKDATAGPEVMVSLTGAVHVHRRAPQFKDQMSSSAVVNEGRRQSLEPSPDKGVLQPRVALREDPVMAGHVINAATVAPISANETMTPLSTVPMVLRISENGNSSHNSYGHAALETPWNDATPLANPVSITVIDRDAMFDLPSAKRIEDETIMNVSDPLLDVHSTLDRHSNATQVSLVLHHDRHRPVDIGDPHRISHVVRDPTFNRSDILSNAPPPPDPTSAGDVDAPVDHATNVRVQEMPTHPDAENTPSRTCWCWP